MVSAQNTEDPEIQLIIDQIEQQNSNYVYTSALSKSQNRLLQEKLSEKVKAEIALLKSDQILLSGSLYEKIHKIFIKIVEKNPEIPTHTKLVLYRSTVFNAFTMGDHVIFFNLGLLDKLQKEEEIAFVISHEIAHNSLDHMNEGMIRSVIMATDDSLNAEIKNASRLMYGNVSALNQLLVPRLFESREQSRTNEYEADSLGLVYFKNAGFSVSEGISSYKAMEIHSKHLSEPFPIESFLSSNTAKLKTSKWDDYSRVGSLGTFEKDDEFDDYLATHPYPKDRFLKLAVREQMDTIFTLSEVNTDTTDLELRKEVLQQLIASSWLDKNLSDVINYAMRYKLEFPNEEEAKLQLSLAFNILSYFKERREAGKYLGRQNPNQPEDIDRIYSFLIKLTPAECQLFADDAGYVQTKNFMTLEKTEEQFVGLLNYFMNEKYELFKLLWLERKNNIYESEYNWVLKEMEEYLYIVKKQKFIKTNK